MLTRSVLPDLGLRKMRVNSAMFFPHTARTMQASTSCTPFCTRVCPADECPSRYLVSDESTMNRRYLVFLACTVPVFCLSLLKSTMKTRSPKDGVVLV